MNVVRIEVGTRPGMSDSRGLSVTRRVREHLGIPLETTRTRDVYHVTGELTHDQAERIAREFAGPVLRRGEVGRIDGGQFDYAVSVGYKPGVTDPVGKSAKVAIEDLLGRSLGPGSAVYSSRLYLLCGVDGEAAERIARELLANPMIERIGVQSYDEWNASDPDLSVPEVSAGSVPAVEKIDLELSDGELEQMSRERLLALTLAEMHAIRDFYRGVANDPARQSAGLDGRATDVELECLAQTWSEHCKHKIMAATVNYSAPGEKTETIRSLFGRYIKDTTRTIDDELRAEHGKSWLVSVFHDNAGVIAANDDYHLVFKVETHNSPSALDPYGGAITGIVGVNRDPFGTGIGAELLSNTWGYCFAPPDHSDELPPGLLHPRRIREGVHQGVIDGGNQSGVPYARGFEIFDERFLGKPLVYCGTVGRMPVTVAGKPGEEKRARPGDRVVMVGGRIGKDGIHGATFSSAELTEDSPVQAVQIGDPITQKMMFDFLLEARDQGLYSAITDNGAGGLSSSVGEMAEGSGGARIDLERAPLKYQGLAAWEILLSEAQERMTLAVPPENLETIRELAQRREVELTDLGEFTDDGLFHVQYGAETVAYMPMSFLHDGNPEMVIEAVFDPPQADRWDPRPAPESGMAGAQLAAEFLARDNLASNEQICRRYDHEVKALTIVKPWIGVHRDVPSDASVMQIQHASWDGYAVTEAVFPTYSDVDAHAMAQAGVDLAVRRLIAAGARPDRIAALDNYCWPDPLPGAQNPDAAHKAAQLVRASRGLAESCLAHGVPLISGKDSMKNDAVIAGRRISVPPTLLISAIGVVRDVRRAMTLEPLGSGELLLVVGETRDELGGTEWAAHRDRFVTTVPRCEPEFWAGRYRRMARLIEDGKLNSVHAIGRGGVLPALFRMARAGDVGLTASLDNLPGADGLGWEARCFGESCGRFLMTCAAERLDEIESVLSGEPFAVLGQTTSVRRLGIENGGATIVDAEVAQLAAAWKRQKGAAR